MTPRYWIAAAGNWLGLPLCIAAMLMIMAGDETNSAMRMVAAGILYTVGYGTNRFQRIMDEEYRRSEPTA
jgi:hypothetical protein